jgi:hypothetical protein
MPSLVGTTSNNGLEQNTKAKPATGRKAYRLTQEIIALSVSRTWDEPKKEWTYLDAFFRPPDWPGACLCGKHPIREICVIGNRLNGNEARVGNCCVKKFLNLGDATPTFAGLRRIAQNVQSAPSKALVKYAAEHGWLTDWELKFCRNPRRRRPLSHRQLVKRVEINQKILALAARKGGADA